MGHCFELEFGVRVLHNICLPDLLFVSPSFSVAHHLFSTYSHQCIGMIRAFGFHYFDASDIWFELPQTELLLRSFLFFMPACVCVCIQLLSSADSNPSELSLCVCMFVLVHFFLVWKNAGLSVYVCLCVCVCMRDVQRYALWYRESFRNAISSLSVYGCIHVGFIRIWKCCTAVPGLASPSVRSPFRSFFGLRGLSGWLMH